VPDLLVPDPASTPVPWNDAALDRAVGRRKDAAWLEKAAADPASRLLLVAEGAKLPVDAAGRLSWRPAAGSGPAGELIFLGVDGEGRPLFALDAGASIEDTANLALFRQIGAELPPLEAAAALEAVALTEWHRRHPFCAQCGARTVAAEGGHLRRCPSCQASHFPRMDPAVIMLVSDGDRCILARRANAPAGRWSTLAGYVEPGESPEAAVAREVFEEVGLSVGAVRYLGSQPWPFPSSLMLVFEAAAPHGPLTVDDEELDEARWFSRPELRAGFESGEIVVPPPITASSFLIRTWLGREGPDAGLARGAGPVRPS
jgi:NAD+ diphosphatase